MAARPVFYGPFARWADRRAAVADARHRVFETLLTTEDLEQVELRLVPPYVEQLNQRFGEQADAIRYRLDRLIEGLEAERTASHDRIKVLDSQLGQVRARLADFPPLAPPEVLEQRNSLELETDRELVAARNQRQWRAERAVHEKVEASLDSRKHALLERVSILNGKIAAVENAGASLVRRRGAHARRRARAYQRWLLLRHPGGAALLRVLIFDESPLPDWVSDQHTAPRGNTVPLTVSSITGPSAHSRRNAVGA